MTWLLVIELGKAQNWKMSSSQKNIPETAVCALFVMGVCQLHFLLLSFAILKTVLSYWVELDSD